MWRNSCTPPSVRCARPRRLSSTTTWIIAWTMSSMQRARKRAHRSMSSRPSRSTCERPSMSSSSAWLLVGAVAAVGVLHTVVPDHWVPITLIARQRGWTQAETARTAFKAGVGHVLSTLAISPVVWLAGVAVAQRFGHWVDTIASVALVGFGLWIAISAWRDLHGHSGHGHSHGHSHDLAHDVGGNRVHGPELQQLQTEHGVVDLSI